MSTVPFFSQEHEKILRECIENIGTTGRDIHAETARLLNGTIPSNAETYLVRIANYRLLWNRDFLASIDWMKVWP